MVAPQQPDETTRLATLRRYGIVGTGPEEAFDRLTRLAASLLDAPVAFLSFVDATRVWIKSRFGATAEDVPRGDTFCTHAVRSDRLMVVPDATRDARFNGSPFVTGRAGLRFYAGAPLIAPDRSRIGTICVLDRRPRRLSVRQRQGLVDLAALAIDQLELRRETSGRTRAEAEALAERTRIASVIQNLPFEFWLCDADGRCLLQSGRSVAHWGDLAGRLPGEADVPADVRARWTSNQALLQGGEAVRTESSYRIGGRDVEVEEILTPLRDAAGRFNGHVGIHVDITGRRRAEALRKESEARLEAAIESLPFDFWICDADGRYVSVNTTTRDHWGTVLGSRPDDTGQPPEIVRLWTTSNERALGGETVRYETSYGEGATLRHVDTILAPVRSDGHIIGLVGVNIDITQHKLAEERIRRLADHDELTGLPNRRLFQKRLEQALVAAARRQTLLALVALDLDDFKGVNDTLGHDAGDRMLCEVARRLTRDCRRSDTIARLGGDEFAILLEDLTRPGDAETVARKVVAGLVEPFRDGNRVLRPSASLGIAIFPEHGRSGGDMLKAADLALYRAKDEGGGRWQIYDEELRVRFERR
jgi:diguanylate cyclase (GGDEF)-like protein/PAS domain S-box-containing protein